MCTSSCIISTLAQVSFTSDSLGVLDVNLGSNCETSVASDLLLKEGMCGGGYRFSATILQSTEEKKRCAFTASAPADVPSRFSTLRRSSFLRTKKQKGFIAAINGTFINSAPHGAASPLFSPIP